MTEPYWTSRDGRHTIYFGDCREILPELSGIDAVVTSPPYGQQREYDGNNGDWRAVVSRAMCSVQDKDSTQFLVNLGLIYRDGECSMYWFDLIDDMRASGYRLFGWYVWDKGFGAPGDWNGRLAPSHEFVFHFNKQSGIVNKWIRTLERKASGSNLRNADGSIDGKTSPDKCGQQFKIPDSVIRMAPNMLRGELENSHPATFPVGLPTHLIRTFTQESESILDPFMGSGTTGVACIRTGRRFIGIDISQAYCDIAIERMERELAQGRLFEPQPEPTQASIF